MSTISSPSGSSGKNSPIKLPSPVGPIKPAPLLGQHNQEIYETLLGLTPNETYELKEASVI